MIQVKASGGKGGLPSDWTEEVTATALEAIAKGDAVEYRMYPGAEVFNGTADSMPVVAWALKYTADRKYRVFADKSLQRNVYIQKLVDGSYQTVYSGVPSGDNANVSALEIFYVDNVVYIYIGYPANTISAVRCYKLVNDTTFSNIQTYSTNYYVQTLKLSDDSTYLGIGLNSTYVKFAKINANTGALTSCTYSGSVTTAMQIWHMDCSCDGVYWIAVGFDGSYYTVSIIKRIGDAFAFLKNIKTNSTTIMRHCAISPDGSRLAHGYPSAPYLYTYSFIDENITQLPSLDVNPGSFAATNNYNSNALKYSPDSAYLYVAVPSAPYFVIYRAYLSTQYIKVANPSTLPLGSSESVLMSADGRIVTIVQSNGSSTPMNYVTGYGDYIIKLHSLAQARQLMPNQFGYFGVGMAKTAAAAGEPCTATMFKKINDAGV